ncbi:hypothetical protein D9615_005811 [Tricholomella constricta]|uniref:Uncharacterized protein n=1 Tax=Tricholomella constricta TaxID=117010 RepID=A0A8H5HAR8_9AGAR|nr:hypothetical protein D9615_005811 [Tricholomella constricta]
MAPFPKLVFLPFLLLLLLLSSIFSSGSAAPLLTRPPPRIRRDAPPTPLTLQAQQQSFSTFTLSPLLLLPQSTIQPLPSIPTTCALHNSPTPQSECPTYFEAANVTYDDCGDAWTVCRCSTADLSMDGAVEQLGRVPVGLRRYVATVLVLPGGPAPRAYTLTDGEVHVFGDPGVDAWVHEAAHALDWATGSPHSGSEGWLGALAEDSCVPDVYSATSAGEDFAQVVVLKTYALLHSDTLPPGWTPDCMAHQLAYLAALPLFTWSTLFANTCAIEGDGADTFSRHSTPPPTLPTRIQPTFPPEAQTQTLPLAAAAAAAAPETNTGMGTESPPSGPKQDNAAAPPLRGGWQLALVVACGVVLSGSFLC